MDRDEQKVDAGTCEAEPRRILATLLAIGSAPIAFALFVHLSYRVALARGQVPFSMFGEAGVWPALWLAAVAGVLCLAYGLTRSPGLRLALCAAYTVLMPVALFVIGYVVGCYNGDC